ncbi:hypothetical protein B0T16DRAFT_486504 [Cercophora newfieldiana]|uniref:Uncharacterized protein n=1 Tax=Cercophora newfieldiana TaxID=92897 RepID=A0AA39YLG6_9PEZI|nr:hypothetical protein B0T16DRAFT_486504 [Cercophora newfieldiana]
MCIRLHLHRMPCDVRPFLTIAKPTLQGRMCIQYTNPYAEPLRCSHRITKTSSCPWNGCCKYTVADLPCSCAEDTPWGREGSREDLTKCSHFREYHEYEFRGDGEGEEWSGYRYLDEWITVDKEMNGEFYCQTGEWKFALDELLRSGEKLLAAVQRADGYQEVMMTRRETDLSVNGEVMGRMEKEVGEAWVEQRGAQRRLRVVDDRRADALLGFSVADEAAPARPLGSSCEGFF